MTLWNKLPDALVQKYTDSNGLLNEFALIFEVRTDMPLHYITFRRCAVAKPHESNTENMFSLSGRLL